MKEMETMDRDDLLVKEKLSHRKKLMKTRSLKDIKKHSLPYGRVNTTNGLEKETVEAKHVHNFKVKFDKKRFGDKTLRL